jgi:hypothetical protein
VKLNAHAFLALDGVMHAPAGPGEDRCGRFGQGGSLIPFADDDMGEIVESGLARDRAQLDDEHLAPGEFHGAYQNK